MELVSIAIIAFLITLISIPFNIRLAKKFGLVDDPNNRPHPAHIHTKIIPRAGGLAIYLAIVLSSLLFLNIEKYLVGIFLGITVLLIIGLIDDRVKRFNPYLRLGLLILAASCAVLSGIGISFITNPLPHLPFLPQLFSGEIIKLDTVVIPFNFIGEHKLILIADLFALIWIMALTQIINWSKGVDGQMPGITAVASITIGVLSWQLYTQGDPNQLNLAKLALITVGTSIGFLIFNWHPAKIFPGFSGSTILAYILAVLSILSGAKVATALLVLAIPTADFIYTFFRRILKGKSPVWGDRGHLHHLLLDRGWSQRAISLFYITGSAILGLVSLLIQDESKSFVVAAAFALSFLFILWANSFGPSRNQ